METKGLAEFLIVKYYDTFKNAKYEEVKKIIQEVKEW